MADDVPVEGGQGQSVQPQSLYQRIDSGLNSVFDPIMSRIEKTLGPRPSFGESLLMGLNTIGPGRGMMPRMGGMGASTPRIPNQPQTPPQSSDLILQMLRQRANPHGVLQSTRAQQATQAPFRGQTFEPIAESLMRPVDAVQGSRVLTPANMTQEQAYNWAVMNQLGRRQ